MKSIQTQAIIEGIRSRKDRSLGLSISTPELSTNEKALFMELQGINVSLFITPSEESHVEEYRVNREMNEKSPSQRLRAVIYRVWEQDHRGFSEFDLFYKSEIEKLINHFKEELV